MLARFARPGSQSHPSENPRSANGCVLINNDGDTGAAFGAAETGDGEACETDQTEARTGPGTSHVTASLTRTTAGHGQWV